MPVARKTRKQIVDDLVFVLSSGLHEATKRLVADNALWLWSGFYDKYDGCPWWSEDAEAVRNVKPRPPLIHDHVVPRRILLDHILSMPPSPDSLRTLLDRFAIGCVITPEQNRRLDELKCRQEMPAKLDLAVPPTEEQLWGRYDKAGIRRIKRELTDLDTSQ